MKTTTLVVLASAVLFVMGCGSGGDAAQTNGVKEQQPQSNVVKSPEDQPMKEMGDNAKSSSSTKVVHDLSEVQPGGSYKIEPKDPNDPHFKPDPKLGGG